MPDTFGELVPGDVIVHVTKSASRIMPAETRVLRFVARVDEYCSDTEWMGQFDSGVTLSTTPDAKVDCVGHVTIGVSY